MLLGGMLGVAMIVGSIVLSIGLLAGFVNAY